MKLSFSSILPVSSKATAAGTKVSDRTNAANRALAIKLCDFLLTTEIQSAVITELGGFPGVSWDNIAPDLREKYKDVVPASIPKWPGGDWDKNMKDGWYRNVAPNVDRSK